VKSNFHSFASFRCGSYHGGVGKTKGANMQRDWDLAGGKKKFMIERETGNNKLQNLQQVTGRGARKRFY